MGGERITFTDKIRREQRDKVHPQSYEVKRVDKPRLIGNYNGKEEKCMIIKNIMKSEKGKPAPNTYKTDILSDIKFHRTLPANLNRHKAERAIPQKKDNNPGPHHYKDKEANYEKHVTNRSLSPSYTYMKEK